MPPNPLFESETARRRAVAVLLTALLGVSLVVAWAMTVIR